MLVSSVQTVAMCSAGFCIVCSFVMFVFLFCRVVMSEMYMLKSVGERTPPYGTPVLRCTDVVFLMRLTKIV